MGGGKDIIDCARTAVVTDREDGTEETRPVAPRKTGQGTPEDRANWQRWKRKG